VKVILGNSEISDAIVEYLERRGLDAKDKKLGVRMRHEVVGQITEYVATIEINTPSVKDQTGGPYR
jgi:hypothetical protein